MYSAMSAESLDDSYTVPVRRLGTPDEITMAYTIWKWYQRKNVFTTSGWEPAILNVR